MMSKDYAKYFETNRRTWNEKVVHHTSSDFYDVENFKKGATSLKTYELGALGDVKGMRLLHLQCHFGQDTLSWARMGAQCTGVDLSDEGIAFAKALSQEIQTHARFVCCNVLDTSEHITEEFDIVFTSYGVIGWLPDLKPWAQMISERLAAGGVFYMVEFHPILWMFDYTSGAPVLQYAYNQKEAIYEEYKGTYAQPDAPMMSKEYGWNHGLGEVIEALAGAGLCIEYLREHDESPYDVFPDLIPQENGLYVTKDHLFPMIFELKATKV